MDSMSAFAMGEANRGKPLMVFDWDKLSEALKVEDSVARDFPGWNET